MAHAYTAVLWNRQKKRYDLFILLGVVIYLITFIGCSKIFNPGITDETLLIRATGTLAFFMLHVILFIGPLSRLDKRFLPLLYNRRHLGVSMFFVSTIHVILNILQFHALGDVNPILSVFISNPDYNTFINFPFQTLGFFAWIILFLMASTSHDFWLANLSPRVWKSLHMLVYLAYFLILCHVFLGVSLDRSPTLLMVLTGLGAIVLAILHVVAGQKEKGTDQMQANMLDGWISAGPVSDIPENRAKIVKVQGERVAIFKYQGKLSAVSNVCQHQNGPLGEGKIIDGLITCPWHGYQYRPHDGCSPPPFTEKVSTYILKLEGEQIFIKDEALEPGTPVEPLKINT
jgi:nitrite reductase/ring-hydroxylating ferredoxin subunit/DMSO/TMAO reductase YedYZ heme-binding membrane subunit